MEISKSPERCTFQEESYIARCKEEGVDPSPDYLQMFLDDKHRHDHKFDEPESRIDNLEFDLVTTDWILEKARKSEVYSQHIYAALCNNDFTKNDVWPILSEKKWSCSWRYAGGIVADMRQEGDYIDWYCSGIRGGYGNDFVSDEDKEFTPEQLEYIEMAKNFVGEGYVTEEIRSDFFKLGWIVVDDVGDE